MYIILIRVLVENKVVHRILGKQFSTLSLSDAVFKLFSTAAAQLN